MQRAATFETRGIDFLLNVQRPPQRRAAREWPEALLADR